MKMIRFQCDLTESRVKDLEELILTTGGGTKKELINNALTLLKWAVKQRQQGKKICAIDDDDNVVELEMPILEDVEPRSNPRVRELVSASA